jgi:hypothetical protein
MAEVFTESPVAGALLFGSIASAAGTLVDASARESATMEVNARWDREGTGLSVFMSGCG